MTLTLVDRQGPSGYLPLPGDVVLEDRTGQPPVANEILALEGSLPVFQHRARVANPALQSSLVEALGGRTGPCPSITSYGTVLVIDAPTWVTLVTSAEPSEFSTVVVRSQRGLQPAPPPSARGRAPAERQNESEVVTPAEELRSITRLPPGMLAELFGVSRTTFYKWVEGATPRDERFQHLVDVLTHVKDARRRLPPAIEFTSWLRTPISPGAKAPLEYLRERRFSLFRGLILRATSAGMGLTAPVASSIPVRAMSPDERALARERVSPSPRAEADEE